ncbi:hypothetical protein COO13_11775 [Bacillus toyonensis]|nr:hypothetical protein COO13_11775 [Bacillus toyonensis]
MGRMRSEIKFRAWDKVNKEMYRVGYIDFPSKKVQLAIIQDGICYKAFEADLKDVELLQYTGLKDSNGNEIYDGDIVKISGHPFQGSIDIDGNYVVGYNELMELSCGGWYLHRMRHWAEVVGNKFENPEILQGGKGE